VPRYRTLEGPKPPVPAVPTLGTMKAYYTDLWFKKRYRGERFVYHLMRFCPTGKRIKRKHRTSAELPISGRKPCKDCTALANEWLGLPTAERTSI
jgi:hypothetical protein